VPEAALARALDDLPAGPGVYFFLDQAGRPLYVGRAASLRRRVRSYWGARADRWYIRRMLPRVARIETVAAASEHEAAFLERALIARDDPPCNRSAGTESVSAIRVTADPPALGAVHELTPGGGRLYGPYLGWERTHAAARALARAYPVHLCAPPESLATLQRDLARTRGVGPADRDRLLREAGSAIERRSFDPLVERLERERDDAAARERYELAAERQAEIEGLGWIAQPQRVAMLTPEGWRTDLASCPAFPARRRPRRES